MVSKIINGWILLFDPQKKPEQVLPLRDRVDQAMKCTPHS